ncbi:hypothetical protein QVK63_000858 [Vibrio vulnificus]|uniref:hypothetical protein n=1 Tax=Vibrio vulnificus TaxID=672 RepID=UPI0028CBF752|nr:hypothetical protein [Vibrio vulnificus]ELO5513599.1 hypothetical protein [Vibrio vulnificus]HDY7750827.1 hypothetical protein [Vibrio vulnificus]HDY8203489.1 hypothetical protein [Vibrio vulnificus]
MAYRPIHLGVKALKKALSAVDKLDSKKHTISDYMKLIRPVLVDMIVPNNMLPASEDAHICRARPGEHTTVNQLMNPPAKSVKDYGRLNDIGESKFYACLGANSKLGSLDEIRADDDAIVTQLSFRVIKQMTRLVSIGHCRVAGMPEPLKRIEAEGVSGLELKKHAIIYNWLHKEFLKSVTYTGNYKKTIAITKLFHELYDPQGIVFPSVSSQGYCTNLVLEPGVAKEHLEPIDARVVKVFQVSNAKGYQFHYLKQSQGIDLGSGDIEFKLVSKFNEDANADFLKANPSEIVNLGNGRFAYPDPSGSGRTCVYSTMQR